MEDVGTVLILVFLPALYAIWYRVKPATRDTRPAEMNALHIVREAQNT